MLEQGLQPEGAGIVRRRCERIVGTGPQRLIKRLQCARWATYRVQQANEYPPDFLMCAQHARMLERSGVGYRISPLKQETGDAD